MWFLVSSLILFIGSGLALIIWRRQATEMQEIFFGGRLHTGCAVVEGVVLLVLALVYWLIFGAGWST